MISSPLLWYLTKFMGRETGDTRLESNDLGSKDVLLSFGSDYEEDSKMN
jgi:hypothetical protein